MSIYKSTLEYLYGLQSRGMKFGLRNIKTLLKSVGNPERKFHSIHIAGTNGKGSTAAFLASIFTEADYTTALYTSPHLVRFTERIRINGIEIPEARLVAYADRLRSMIEQTQATFFEATTCIAFQYFADEQVDIAIVECGLGGRLDSTNVVQPLVSVITNVSFDHMEYLGNTLPKIAREKAGIMKRSVPCVTASNKRDVLLTLRNFSRARHSQLIRVQKRTDIKSFLSAEGRATVNLRAKRLSVEVAKLGLDGSHQIANAATAFTAVDVLLSNLSRRTHFAKVDNTVVKRGLENVQKNTGLQGRLSRSAHDKRFILDVAHNRDGMETLERTLTPQVKENLIIVFGVMKDKEYRAMSEIVARMGRHVVAVTPKGIRGLPASEISLRVNLVGGKATAARSVRHGIAIAKRLAGKRGNILVTGSNYVVGEAMETFSRS